MDMSWLGSGCALAGRLRLEVLWHGGCELVLLEVCARELEGERLWSRMSTVMNRFRMGWRRMAR